MSRVSFIAMYPSDFLADVGHLGNTELGIYWRLLLVYYRDGRPLPVDPDRLRRIAMTFSPEECRALDQVVSEFFVLTSEEDGTRTWHHKRADVEIAKATHAHDKKSAAARATNEKRWKNAKQDAERSLSDSASDREPEPEPEPEKKTESVSKGVQGEQAPRKRSAEAQGSRLPNEWQLPKAWGEWSMAELHMSRDTVRLEADKFRDYWHGLAGAKGRKADWQATWRNWCRNVQTSLKTPIKGLAESFRERDARLAAERVAEATGGLSVDRAALRKPLPFEAGYQPDVIEGESNVRRIA